MKKLSLLLCIPIIMMITVSSDIETSGIQSDYELGTKTVAHVAIVVKSIEKTTGTYAELFGMEPPEISLGVSPQYMGKPTEGKAKMAFIELENITLEFFEPVGGPSAWQDFLDTKGEGIHHFGFFIKDLEDHVEFFESRDMPVIQSGGGDWGRYRYVDATSGLATMIELLELSKPE
jgi:catechol 2,3-dioxygenase-like lactoylglutathione lyase family enzyme